MGPLAQDVIFVGLKTLHCGYSCTFKLGILVVTTVTLITGIVISWEFVLFDSCMVAERSVITVDHDGNQC